MDIVSTNVTNTIATGTVSINCHNKKVGYKIDCHILHTILLVVILLLVKKYTMLTNYYFDNRKCKLID